MGQVWANGGRTSHARGTSPITHAFEIFAHWGDENINEKDEVTDAQADDLYDDANVSQAAFDTTADSIVSWYGFTGLSSDDRDTMRATIRDGWAHRPG